MPRSNWAFSVLSVVNAAVGLWGSWLLIGRFAEDDRRRAATFMLLLTPFYIFLALKFNANSIFLSLWPWTAYFLVRSLDDCRVPAAAAFGMLMAFDMLSKYVAVLLGVVCLVAACVHPNRRRYFGSAAPYVSVAVAAALCAPHLWWLVDTGFLPFQYFSHKVGKPVAWSSWISLKVIVGAVLFHAPMIAVLMFSGAKSPLAWPRNFYENGRDQRYRTLAVLALLPVILVAAAGILFRIEVDTNMTIGMFPLLPLLLITIARPDGARLLAIVSPIVAALLAASLLASPIVAFTRVRYGDIPALPYKELASEATQIFREKTGARLAFVGSTSRYGRAIAFYSEDAPQDFTGFDFRYAPWVTPEALSRDGLLAVCLAGDFNCLAAAAKFETSEATTVTVTVAHTFMGYRAAPKTFVLIIVPPRA